MHNGDRKKGHKLSVERLEERRLMAADFSNGVLTVTGTSGRDVFELKPLYTDRNALAIKQGSDTILSVPMNQIREIKVVLGTGNDSFTMNVPSGTLNPALVDINMGGGNKEGIHVIAPKIGTLNIRAAKTVDVGITLAVGRIDSATVTTGVGQDSLVINNSSIGSLAANLGDHKDLLSLRNSTVAKANVDMGSGNDTVFLTNSEIQGGSVSGGSGIDSFLDDIGSTKKKTSVKQFEK